MSEVLSPFSHLPPWPALGQYFYCPPSLLAWRHTYDCVYDSIALERERDNVSHLLSIEWKMLIQMLAGRPRKGFDLFPLSNVKGTGVLCKYNDFKSRRLGCYYLCM
jgi:hypothetical protein